MTNAHKPRISPGDRRQLGWLNFGITKLQGRATRSEPPRVFTTIGRNRRLFRRWIWFASAVMFGKLPRQETELVILRVAHNNGSDYEWGQHERMGQRVGLTEEEISRVRTGPSAPGWSERRALLLQAADEMHEKGQIGKELWAQLGNHLDDLLLIELCMLIGHYEMMAMTLKTLEIEPEQPVRL